MTQKEDNDEFAQPEVHVAGHATSASHFRMGATTMWRCQPNRVSALGWRIQFVRLPNDTVNGFGNFATTYAQFSFARTWDVETFH